MAGTESLVLSDPPIEAVLHATSVFVLGAVRQTLAHNSRTVLLGADVVCRAIDAPALSSREAALARVARTVFRWIRLLRVTVVSVGAPLAGRVPARMRCQVVLASGKAVQSGAGIPVLFAESVGRVFDSLAAHLAAEIVGLAITPPAVQVPSPFAPWSSAVVIGAKRGYLGQVLGVSRRVPATRQLAGMQLATSASLGSVRLWLLAIGNCTAVLAAGDSTAALLICAIVSLASVLVAVVVALRTARSAASAFPNPAQMVLAEWGTGLRRHRAFNDVAGMRLAVARGLII